MPQAPTVARPERRAHPRAAAEMPVTIGHEDRRIAARVRDLSASGVRFLSPQPLAEMTAVRLDLELPGQPSGAAAPERIAAEGAIVRCVPAGKEHEVAVYFTSIPEDARAAIRRFVEARRARA
jgi:hypothetical protein